jgi:hypothetical protein
MLLAILAAISGTAPVPAEPAAGAELSQFQQVVDSWLQDHLLDFEGARLKLIFGPKQMRFKKTAILKVEGETACYDINAKNAYGAYTGWDRTLFVVRDGKVVYHVSDRYPDGFTAFDVIGKVCGSSGRPGKLYFQKMDPSEETRSH